MRSLPPEGIIEPMPRARFKTSDIIAIWGIIITIFIGIAAILVAIYVRPKSEYVVVTIEPSPDNPSQMDTIFVERTVRTSPPKPKPTDPLTPFHEKAAEMMKKNDLAIDYMIKRDSSTAKQLLSVAVNLGKECEPYLDKLYPQGRVGYYKTLNNYGVIMEFWVKDLDSAAFYYKKAYKFGNLLAKTNLERVQSKKQ